MDMITYQPQPVGVYIQLCTSKPCPDLRIRDVSRRIDPTLESFPGFVRLASCLRSLRRRSCDVFVNESHVRRMFESDKMSVYNSDITIVLHQKK